MGERMVLEREEDADPHVRRETLIERYGIALQPLDEVWIRGGGHSVCDAVRSKIVQGGTHLIRRTFLAGVDGETKTEAISRLTQNDEVALLLGPLRAGEPEVARSSGVRMSRLTAKQTRMK